MKDNFIIPDHVIYVLDKLENAGHEAFIVGGCVRDHILGRTPDDYDITTSATPKEVADVFSDHTVIPTGEKHGTVTIIVGTPLEVTTYRTEGGYSDHRHPDSISFTASITEDLSRRDFTINAIAFSPKRGYRDPFGGMDDAEKKIIRAVGDPKKRFDEDALRILRGVRFASVLGFSVEQGTERALYEKRSGLRDVSAERIFTELKKLLCGKAAGETVMRYCEIIGEVIPELLPMIGFDQRNKYHKYDLLEHTARVIDGVPPMPHLRLAAMLHDIAKPDCFFTDEYGGHFHGHEKCGSKKAHEILVRLKADKLTRQSVTDLVLHHGLVLQKDESFIKRCLNRFGKDAFRDIISLSLADNSALSDLCSDRAGKIREISELTEKIILEQPCFTLSDLAVKGSDLIALGLKPGPIIGARLKEMLDAVISGEVENTKEALTEFFTERWLS